MLLIQKHKQLSNLPYQLYFKSWRIIVFFFHDVPNIFSLQLLKPPYDV